VISDPYQHTRLENRVLWRILSSPVALAFMRAAHRRGISEARARKVYLDYLNRLKPAGNRRQRNAA
jgi:hypothetical protein